MLCSVLALHNAMRIGPVPLIEELRGRYGADYATVGNVVGAYTLAYGFAQLAAGFLADRFGSRRVGRLRVLAVLGLRSRRAGSGAGPPSLTLCERRVYGRQRCAGRNTALRNGPDPRPRT